MKDLLVFSPRCPLQTPRVCKLNPWFFLHLVVFDDVAFTNVIELAKPNTAFVTFADFSDIVGEAPYRTNSEDVADNLIVTQQTGLGLTPYHTTGNHENSKRPRHQ